MGYSAQLASDSQPSEVPGAHGLNMYLVSSRKSRTVEGADLATTRQPLQPLKSAYPLCLVMHLGVFMRENSVLSTKSMLGQCQSWLMFQYGFC